MDVWSIVILIFVAQGLFTLSVLLFSKQRKGVRANVYLGVLMAFMVWILLEFLSIRTRFSIPLNSFYGTRYGSWLLAGPLVYYFYSALTKTDWKFGIRAALHLLPFIVFVLAIPLLNDSLLSTRQVHYGMLAVFDHRPKTTTFFEYLYSTVFYLQFLHLGAYLLYNFKMITSYNRKLKNQYSNINEVVWLHLFNALLIITLVFASLYLYILFKSDFYSRSLDYIYAVPMGFFIYSIGYYLSGLHWRKVPSSNQKYQASNLKEEEKAKILKDLTLLMDKEKMYLLNDLRIKDLATKLGVSAHHVSQVINEHYHCSFFDFINKHRVKEAQYLMRSFPEKNLLQISFDAGFNNKTSFVNAFKKFTSKTPSAYRKGL
ncbi:helix-turn-helix domain-containing protein [Spongiimicrobium salis]|uniref:helix-turn-helix domain-containing protein n=1 Tax=Spongiimicrobium salis TaxID=1667022 RepID=UPI00374DCCB0